jgi:hypothetical protein
MAHVRISVDPIYLQTVATLHHLKVAEQCSDPKMEKKRLDAIDALSKAEAVLKAVRCGAAMGIKVSFK